MIELSNSQTPASLEELGGVVQVRIEEMLDAEKVRWSGVDTCLVEPLEELWRMVAAGGKRLRPAFCYWAYVGAGGDPDDPLVVDAGAALELLHTFALIHDDIMDGSLKRRGLDAVQVTFSDRHRLAGWRGESRRFGDGVGVLVGDLAFVYADQMLAAAPRPARDVFTELRLEVNLGQYLDVYGTAKKILDPEFASKVCIFKSGKYTVERPLHLGAALNGALEEFQAPLTDYGLPLGEAFQLRDDVLGVFGDATVTGKPVGDDLREGKPTLLVALAAEKGDVASLATIEDLFGRPDLDEAEICQLQAVIVESGALALVESRIEMLVDRALVAISASELTHRAISELEALAIFVASRRS